MVLEPWRRGLACSLFALVIAGPVSAQVTGSIAGTIRDSSGAVLPGVTVTIKGPALQRQSVTVTTVADGTYRIPLLPPGVYDVAVELTGFATQTRRGIDIGLDQPLKIDHRLLPRE